MGLLGYAVMYSSMKSRHDASSMSSQVCFTVKTTMISISFGPVHTVSEITEKRMRRYRSEGLHGRQTGWSSGSVTYEA